MWESKGNCFKTIESVVLDKLMFIMVITIIKGKKKNFCWDHMLTVHWIIPWNHVQKSLFHLPKVSPWSFWEWTSSPVYRQKWPGMIHWKHKLSIPSPLSFQCKSQVSDAICGNVVMNISSSKTLSSRKCVGWTTDGEDETRNIGCQEESKQWLYYILGVLHSSSAQLNVSPGMPALAQDLKFISLLPFPLCSGFITEQPDGMQMIPFGLK